MVTEGARAGRGLVKRQLRFQSNLRLSLCLRIAIISESLDFEKRGNSNFGDAVLFRVFAAVVFAGL